MLFVKLLLCFLRNNQQHSKSIFLTAPHLFVRSETTTATLLASDARSARLMDDMTSLALAPRTAIRNRTARSFRSASNDMEFSGERSESAATTG
jgi:hypothetical protein